MNPDLQSAHKPDGAHHGKVAHRPLHEEVLQSAVEVAKGEVLQSDVQQKLVEFTLQQRLADKASRFVLMQPMKASMLAASAGAMLALLLQQSLKMLVKHKR